MNIASLSLKMNFTFKATKLVCFPLQKLYNARYLQVNILSVNVPWSKPIGVRFIRTHGRDADSLIDHLCAIDIYAKVTDTRLSGIICTIGPASRTVAMLEKMIEAGMQVARIDYLRGSREYHSKTIGHIRKAVENYSTRIGRKYPLAVAVDAKGQGINTGNLEDGDWAEVRLEAGAEIKLTTDNAFENKCTSKLMYVDYEDITKVVSVGDRIFFDHNGFSMVVTKIGTNDLDCVVEDGGMLESVRSLNIPGIILDLPEIHDKLKHAITFCIEQDVDMIFASFVGSASVIQKIRQELGEKGKQIMVVSKIETRQGIDNLDEIMEASDAIMVARGSLSVELGYESVFTAQAQIIARCNKAGLPVICATDMLASMMAAPRPTRAEATDVANAVLDGADCVMLSGGTEVGSYPLQSLVTMERVCLEAEATLWQRQRFTELVETSKGRFNAWRGVALTAVRSSYLCSAAAIVVLTVSGRSAQLISKFRPRCPVIAVSRLGRVARHNQLFRGILSVEVTDPPLEDWSEDVVFCLRYGLGLGLERGFVKTQDMVVVVTCWHEASTYTDTVRVMVVGDLLAREATF